MQVTNVGDGPNDLFAFYREDQPQSRVRSRVLRTKIQRPEVVLLPLRRRFVECIENFERHCNLVSLPPASTPGSCAVRHSRGAGSLCAVESRRTLPASK